MSCSRAPVPTGVSQRLRLLRGAHGVGVEQGIDLAQCGRRLVVPGLALLHGLALRCQLFTAFGGLALGVGRRPLCSGGVGGHCRGRGDTVRDRWPVVDIALLGQPDHALETEAAQLDGIFVERARPR